MFVKIMVVSAFVVAVQCCRAIKNVEVNAILTDETPLNIKINGCFDRRAFLDGNKTRNTVEIDVNQQNIPRLEKDSIKHFLYLRKITIRNSNLTTLDLDIFRNTPKLQTVDFISNDIEVIRDGVYNYQNFESVSLYNNKIHSMDDLAFSNMNLLKYVNISYNRLKIFKGAWFYKVPSLTTIDFQHNLIDRIPSRAFGNITAVKTILFNHNNIAVIERDAFADLRSLEMLDLGHNLLQTIAIDSFPKKMKINMMSLNANRINSLSQKLFDNVAFKAISFDGNPWNCFCYRPMLNLLEKKGVMVQLSDECKDVTIPTCAIGSVTKCEEEPNAELTKYYYGLFSNEIGGLCVRFFYE